MLSSGGLPVRPRNWAPPAMTNDGDVPWLGRVKEKAKNDSSAGGSISGQTLLRATGLTVPSNRPHSASVFTYCSLKRRNPSSENAAGERSSQAQNALSTRPAALTHFTPPPTPPASRPPP